MTRACTPGSRLRAIDILIPSTRSTIEEGKEGKKEGRGKHESRGNHASGKMGNDEFLAGVRACFFARRRKNEGKRKRERRADGIEANLGSASFSQRQKNLGKSLMERLSSGGTILVRRSSRVFLAPSNRKATPRGNTRRSEKEREREKGPRLSRSHKTNERIPFFSRVPSRGKGTRRKRRQKENGRQHRFDLTEWGMGGNLVLERYTQRCLERKGRRMTNPRFRSFARYENVAHGIGITRGGDSFLFPFLDFSRERSNKGGIKDKERAGGKCREARRKSIIRGIVVRPWRFFLKRRRRNRDGTPRSFHLHFPLSPRFSLPRPPSLTLHTLTHGILSELSIGQRWGGPRFKSI